MSALWTSAEIAAATGGAAHGDFEASGVAFDSREVEPGDLFVAMKGEATDGHLFLDKAFAAGAAGAIVSERDRPAPRPRRRHDRGARTTSAAPPARAPPRGSAESPARSARPAPRRRCSPRSTAPRPAAAHRSVKSYNNHTGVPLSLARMPRETPLRRVRDGHEPCRRARRADPAGPAARRHRHRDRPRPPRLLRQRGGDRRRQGRDLRGAGGGRHRARPLRQPASRPARRRRPAACRRGSSPSASARAPTSAPATSCRRRAAARWSPRSCPEAELTFTISQPGEHWVSNALAVLGAVEAMGGDLAAAGLALADLAGLKGRGERHRIRARRRRGAADRRKLQRQSRLDGGDPEDASAP